MFKALAIAIATAGIASLAWSYPLEARATKSKVQRADAAPTSAKPRRNVASTQRGNGNEVYAGTSGLRDRTAIYNANGRLNGQALFDSISERTSGAGE